MWPEVSFEYKGKTALTVRGNISGKNYRFSKPGDIQQIEKQVDKNWNEFSSV